MYPVPVAEVASTSVDKRAQLHRDCVLTVQRADLSIMMPSLAQPRWFGKYPSSLGKIVGIEKLPAVRGKLGMGQGKKTHWEVILLWQHRELYRCLGILLEISVKRCHHYHRNNNIGKKHSER